MDLCLLAGLGFLSASVWSSGAVGCSPSQSCRRDLVENKPGQNCGLAFSYNSPQSRAYDDHIQGCGWSDKLLRQLTDAQIHDFWVLRHQPVSNARREYSEQMPAVETVLMSFLETRHSCPHPNFLSCPGSGDREGGCKCLVS